MKKRPNAHGDTCRSFSRKSSKKGQGQGGKESILNADPENIDTGVWFSFIIFYDKISCPLGQQMSTPVSQVETGREGS